MTAAITLLCCLVGGEVDHQVGLRDQFLVGADLEIVVGGVLPRLPLLGDRFGAQGIGDIEAAVAEVEPLVEALGATADDDDLLSFQGLDAVEFRGIHEPALRQLLQLPTQRQGIEIVRTHFFISSFLDYFRSLTGIIPVKRIYWQRSIASSDLFVILYCISCNRNPSPARPITDGYS